MTAEIAILNKHAVALAADSSVTIGQSKAWKTANKLFSLSPANDIGIMIYGLDNFGGYSWETIAKTFRQKMGNYNFSTIYECGEAFLNYLRSDIFESDNVENFNILALSLEILNEINEEIGEQDSLIEKRKSLQSHLNRHASLIQENYGEIDNHSDMALILEDNIEQIEEILVSVFDFSLTKKLRSEIIDLLFLAFRREVESSLSSGVVIAGYGKDQFFPELISYTVDGNFDGFVRAWINRWQNLNEVNGSNAAVIPFAQSDMSQLFMEGITHDHISFIHYTLIRVLNDKSDVLLKKYVADTGKRRAASLSQKKDNEKIMQKFSEEFYEYIQGTMIQPVIKVVSSLPKEEMAAMAEALVEITTLRRKVDSTVESVGGPTDVAIVSKGDGLVWIKRKHYFDLELNSDFPYRKRVRHGDGDAPEIEE